MDAQVDFVKAEKAVEGFVTSLQELKEMMQKLNNQPITRLKGVESLLVTPMQEAVKKLSASGTQMVSQLKANAIEMEKIAEKAGEAVGDGLEKGFQTSSGAFRRSLKGHFDAYRGIVSDESKALKAEVDKANQAALMLGVNPNSVAAATRQAKQAMKGHYDALGVYVSERAAELTAKAEANQAALARVYAKLGSQATADTGARLLSNPTSGGGAGRTPTMFDDQIRAESVALKNHMAELERVATLKAQIKRRIETSDVAFKPTTGTRLTTDQSDGQYTGAMAAMRAHYSALEVSRAPVSESAQANLRAAAALREKTTALSEGTKAATKSGGPLKTLTSHLTDVHSAARGVASGFGMMWLTWGKLTPLLAGAALSNSLVQTAEKGKEFETVLAGIEFMGEQSATSVAKLAVASLSLGSSTQYGPVEVAKGLKTLALAGLDAEQSLAAIRPMLDFATVSELPLDKAAESLMGISKAFGYTASEVSVVGDVVAKAAAVSMSSVSDMTEAFKQSSTVAQQFGVTLQDQSVALAQLAQIGIRGSAAGTAVRNMYVELMGSSKKARKVLQDTLKVDVFDNATKAMKPLPAIMRELAVALSGFDAQSQQHILHAIGNERGMKATSSGLADVKKAADAAGVSLKDYVASMSDMQRKLEEAPGFMAVAAAGMSATTENIMKSVGGTLQGSMIKAFEEMSPYLINFSQSLKQVFASPEFVQGLKDTIRLVGDGAQGFAAAVKFVWEYRDATLAAAVGLATLKVGTAVIGALGLTWAGAGAALRTVVLTMGVAGPAAGAAAVGTTALAGAMSLLKVALGPISIALSAAAAAYYYFSGAAKSESEKAADATKEANDEIRRSLETKRAVMVESINAEIAQLKLYIKHKGDEKAMAKEAADAKTKEAADAANSTITKLLSLSKEASGAQIVEAAYKRLQAAELERNNSFGGGNTASVDKLREEARLLDEAARNTRAKGEFEANVFRGQLAYQAALAKEKAKIANERAARKPEFYGPKKFDPDSGSGSNKGRSLSIKHDNELAQIEKRYADELAMVKGFEQNEQKYLKERHAARLITDGQFYAEEALLAQRAEADQLALIQRTGEEYSAAQLRQLDSMRAQHQDYLDSIKGKDNATELAKKAQEELDRKLIDSGNAATTFWQKLNNDGKSVEDNAIARVRSQTIKAEGAIKALALETEKFWKDEARSRAKAAEQTKVEDALRYASPEQAAYVSAYARESERLNDVLYTQDERIRVLTESVQDAADMAWLEADANDELNKSYKTQAEELKKLKAARDALAGRLTEKAQEQGNLAVVRFQKDEQQRLSEAVADAIATGLMEGGQAGKRKLRDLIVNELRKQIVLNITAIINPIIGAIMGSLGIGGGAGGAASALGMAANGASLYGAAGGFGGLFGGMGIASGATYGTAFMSQQSLMLAAQETMGMGGALAGSAAGSSTFGSMVSMLTKVPGWGWAMAAFAVLASLFDDSGTPHTGGLGSYSAAGGSAYGDAVKGQGMDFDLSSTDYNKATEGAAASMARSVVEVLDAGAKAFGKKAGFFAAAAFADDSSRDGSWGGLLVKDGNGNSVIDWKNGSDRWPGREFSDGEAGMKEYEAAVAKDVRDYLVSQAPGWAADILRGLGDNPTMEALTNAVNSIANLAKAVELLGKGANAAIPALSGLTDAAMKALIKAAGGADSLTAALAYYYDNFTTPAQRFDNATATASSGFAALGLTMPTTGIEEWYQQKIKEAAALDLTVEANAKYLANLLAMAPATRALADEERNTQVLRDRLAVLRGTRTQREIDLQTQLEGAANSAQAALIRMIAAAEDMQTAWNFIGSAIGTGEEEVTIDSEGQSMDAALQAILDFVSEITSGALEELKNSQLSRAQMEARYREDLAGAQAGDLEATKRLTQSARNLLDSQIDQAVTAVDARRAAAKMAIELAALPDPEGNNVIGRKKAKTPEEMLVEALKGLALSIRGLMVAINESDLSDGTYQAFARATTNLTAAFQAVKETNIPVSLKLQATDILDKLTNGLTVAVRAEYMDDGMKALAAAAGGEIARAITVSVNSAHGPGTIEDALFSTEALTRTFNLIVGTENLDPAVRNLALGLNREMAVTISAIMSKRGLSAEEVSMTLGAVNSVDRLVNIIVSSDSIPQEMKEMALGTALPSINRTIRMAAEWLSGEDLELVNRAMESATKEIELALASGDPEALRLATAKALAIEAIIKASAGPLSPEVRALLAEGDTEKIIRYAATLNTDDASERANRLAQPRTVSVRAELEDVDTLQAMLDEVTETAITKTIDLEATLDTEEAERARQALQEEGTVQLEAALDTDEAEAAKAEILSAAELGLTAALDTSQAQQARDAVTAEGIAPLRAELDTSEAETARSALLESATAVVTADVLDEEAAVAIAELITARQVEVAASLDDAAARSALDELTQPLSTTLTVYVTRVESGVAVPSSGGGAAPAAAAAAVNVPQFAVGTNYVPADMLAVVHKGERIIPEADNAKLLQAVDAAATLRNLGNRSELWPRSAPKLGPISRSPAERVWSASPHRVDDTTDARVAAILERVHQELVDLRFEAQATAGHTSKTARILTRVTKNGEAVITTPA